MKMPFLRIVFYITYTKYGQTLLTCLPGGERGARAAAGGRQERPEELLHQPDPQRPAAAGGAEPERGGPLLAPPLPRRLPPLQPGLLGLLHVPG